MDKKYEAMKEMIVKYQQNKKKNPKKDVEYVFVENKK